MHLSPLPFNTGMSQKSQNQQSKNNLPPQPSQQHQSSLTASFQPVVDREPLGQLVTQSQQVLSSEHQQQQLQHTELVSRTSSAHVPATENDARQSQHINNAGFTKRRQPSMVNYKENQQQQLQSHQPKCQGNPLDTLSLPEAPQSLPGGAQLKLPSSADQSRMVAAFKAIQQCSFQDMLHHPDVPPVIHPSTENNTVHQNADRQTTDSNTYQNVNNQSAAFNITYQNVDNQNAASNTTYQNVNNQSAASNTTYQNVNNQSAAFSITYQNVNNQSTVSNNLNIGGVMCETCSCCANSKEKIKKLESRVKELESSGPPGKFYVYELIKKATPR